MGYKATAEEQTGLNLVHIEEGIYSAKLKDVELRKITVRDGDREEERDILQWTFDVETEEGIVEIQGITSTKFSTGRNPSKFYKWACALLGRTIEPGEEIDTDDLLGIPCTVIVEDRKLADGTIISRVTDVKKASKRKKKA